MSQLGGKLGFTLDIELEYVEGKWIGSCPWGTHIAPTWEEVVNVLWAKRPKGVK